MDYEAEIHTQDSRVHPIVRFEIRAHAVTALYCPLYSRTRDVVRGLSVYCQNSTTDDDPTREIAKPLRRVAREIILDPSNDASLVLNLGESSSKQVKWSSFPIEVWEPPDESVRIFSGIDEIDDASRQLVLDAINRDAAVRLSTSVIVTRRADIAQTCTYITYIEDDQPYTNTLDQGRKSYVVHVKRHSVVRKFYNENGDKLLKSRCEIGFYLHYQQSDVIPNLVNYREASHITIEYVPGKTISELGFADNGARVDFTRRFARSVGELICRANPVTDELKSKYYDGLGASAILETTTSQLHRLAPNYIGCAPYQELIARVGQVQVSNELLIKLDWNSSNTIVRENGRLVFVDFEQAFIGTPEMLIGMLLHNPDWCACTLMEELQSQLQLSLCDEELSNMVHFAFACVFVDSITRSGAPWSTHRLASAYELHVLDRLAAI